MSSITMNAIETIAIEVAAVEGLVEQITEDFEDAVREIIESKGKVVVTGMGKSGLIGAKIAATLSSTGTTAVYMHPADAYHGDLGMIAKADVVIAISYSGQTDEVLKLIPFLESNGNLVISITGRPGSTLAKHSKYHINVAVKKEACPLHLAPTSSTTATLVMGDALAVALMNQREFKIEDFARFHPGGSLGRRLLTKVSDVMRSDGLPIVPPTMKLSDVIIEISNARLGIAIVVKEGKIEGLVTDGDVRRAMLKYQSQFFDLKVKEIMTRTPKIISPSDRITDAEDLMRKNKIHSLIVANNDGALVGVVELYDLMADAKQ